MTRSSMPRLGALSVLVATAMSGCSEPGPFDGIDADRPALFAEGVVSTEQREYGITFSADLGEAYFTRRPRRGPPQIYVTRYTEGGWSEPELAPFSGASDESPFLATDGTRLLFSSRRPLPGSGDRSNNLWEVRREAAGWSEPVPLDGDVNEPLFDDGDYVQGREYGPIVLPDGSLVFTSGSDPDWGADLFVAQPTESGGFVDATPLRLNGPGDESNPAVSPDGSLLLFQAYRSMDGIGEQDLYAARRTDTGWSTPTPLPEPLNSRGNDGYPSFSADGDLLFFASDRDARSGYYSIYFVSADRVRQALEER